MLRNRFSSALLAVLLVAATSGSVSAADVISESTLQINETTYVSAPAASNEEVQTPEAAALLEVTEPNAEPQAPAEVTEPAVEPQAPAEVTEPAVEPQTPAAEEQPAVETPVAEPEVIAPVEEQIATEPAITVEKAIATEPAITVEEAIATEPAIVVEPVPATLTITHRLIVGDQYSDEIQVIDGLEVGQTLDLTDYLAPVDWAECITQETNISLNSAENTVVLEYVVKADAEVKVIIENNEVVLEQGANDVTKPDESVEASDTVQ